MLARLIAFLKPVRHKPGIRPLARRVGRTPASARLRGADPTALKRT